MISKTQAKYIQSLGHKKYRDEEGLFIAEGPKLVKELLQSKNARLEQLYALDEWIDQNEDAFPTASAIRINAADLERISQLKTPNQVVAVFKKFASNAPIAKGKISLVLDGIQDPGNLGTIVRIADWFGVHQIICNPECADLYNPKVVQASMGSIARVNVFYSDVRVWLRQQAKIDIFASMLQGKDVTKMAALKEGLIIIGNESKGISKDLAEFATEEITIPRKGEAESLNAAIATGIILSHLV